MMAIERILTNRRLTLALTGVTPEEFHSLLPVFTKEWEKSKKRQHRRDAGVRALGGGRKGFLKTMQEKMFFELFYWKCYPTYDMLSALFDCNRSNACRRQFELAKILEKTLKRKRSLPKRQIRTLDEFFEAFPEAKEVFIDGSERPVQRPGDSKKQKSVYSGKKKRHTKKNIVITEKNKRVGFLGKTARGKEHDFTLLKKQIDIENIPKDITQHVDLGFKGMEKQYPKHSVSIPQRKPRTKDLTQHEKEQNTSKSSVRVLVENALAGVKRMRITTDIFRNRKKNFDDTAMLVSCGLWNYHLAESK